jgi:hypothetical protein
MKLQTTQIKKLRITFKILLDDCGWNRSRSGVILSLLNDDKDSITLSVKTKIMAQKIKICVDT